MAATNIDVTVEGRTITLPDDYERPSTNDVQTCTVTWSITGLLADMPNKRVTFDSRTGRITQDYADVMTIPQEVARASTVYLTVTGYNAENVEVARTHKMRYPIELDPCGADEGVSPSQPTLDVVSRVDALAETLAKSETARETAYTEHMTEWAQAVNSEVAKAATATAQSESATKSATAAAGKATSATTDAKAATDSALAAASTATDAAKDAKSATTAAKTATDAANTSAAKADAATSKANASAAKADTAAANADTATSAAKSATSAAESATTAAKDAVTKATASASACDTATAAAKTATSNADTATGKANTAATKADTAAANADTATAAAKTATSDATAAAETATTAAGKADTATANATAAATSATTAATAANTAATTATESAGKADTATESANTAAANANKAAETAYAAAKAVETATLGLSAAQISAMVKMGNAPTVFPIGSQINTPLYDNDGNVYVEQFAWDVVHHFDGSDADHPLVTCSDGKQRKGMMLMAHRTLPWSIVFDSKQAAIAVTGDMPAGTYHFTVTVTAAWSSGIAATVGSKTYQFTTTQALTAGAQLVYSGSEKTDPTTATLIAYANATSTTELGRYALSLGSDGTDLGVMTDASPSTNATSYALLNNIERMIYGSNRWSTSQERAVLNANGVVVQDGVEFTRPWNMAGQKGMLARLPEDFVSVLGHVARTQELHPWDGKGHDSSDNYLETVYDYLFPISAREHYFDSENKYLGQTSAGFKAEGVVLDYWQNFAAASGMSGMWAGWKTYPELITYDSKATTTARYVWLRSARRGASAAFFVGYVNTSGCVSNYAASTGYFAAPACIIV